MHLKMKSITGGERVRVSVGTKRRSLPRQQLRPDERARVHISESYFLQFFSFSRVLMGRQRTTTRTDSRLLIGYFCFLDFAV